MSERKLIVRTAQGWFDSAQDSSNTMAERLLFMENALNHTENALVAVNKERDDLRAKLEAAERENLGQSDLIERLKAQIANRAADKMPYSFVNMNWACGHEGGAACQQCFHIVCKERNELQRQVETLQAKIKAVAGAAREQFKASGCLPVNCTYCTAANCGHKELGKALAKLDSDSNAT